MGKCPLYTTLSNFSKMNHKTSKYDVCSDDTFGHEMARNNFNKNILEGQILPFSGGYELSVIHEL